MSPPMEDPTNPNPTLAEAIAEDTGGTGPSSNPPGGGVAGGGLAPDLAESPDGVSSLDAAGGVDQSQSGAALPVPPPPPPPPPVTWGARLRGLLGGVVRSPFTAGAAVADTESDLAKSNPTVLLGMPSLAPSAIVSMLAFNGHAAQFERNTPLAHIGDPSWNEVTAQILSFAIGGTGVETAAGRGVRALAQGLESGALRFGAQTAITGAEAGVTSALMVDPEQERFSNALQSMGLHNAFTDYLAHTDDETRAEGRWKNAVEGTLTGLAADQMFRVGRYWFKALKGDAKGAGEIASEIGSTEPASEGAKQDTIEAVPATEASAGQAPIAKPEETTGPITWEQNPDGSLQASFLPREEASGAQGTPGVAGKEPAAPDTGAVDSGRVGGVPRAPDQPKDAIIFRFTEGDQAGQPIGATTRADLKALGEDVSIWRSMVGVAGRDATNVEPGLSPDAASRVGNFHLAPIGTSDNVAPLLRAFVDRLPSSATRSDADLMQTVMAASKDIGEDPNALVEASRLISGKLQDADVAMATLRTVWARAAKDIDELNVPGVDWTSVSDEDFGKAAQAIHNMTSISTFVQQAKQALGRGLRVNQLPDAGTYLGSLAKDGEEVPPMSRGNMSPLPRTKDELANWMDLWKTTQGDPLQRARMLSDLLTVPPPGQYLRTAFANQFTANILSAPRTVLIHLIGPAFINTLQTVERLSGAAVNSINPFLSAEERQAARSVASATVPAYFSSITDAGTALRQAWKAGQEGSSILGGPSYFDANASMGPLTDNLLRAAGTEPDWRYSLGNLINVWPRTLSRTLTGLSEFSKTVAYNGFVRVNAMAEASQQGLTGDAAQAFVANQMHGAFDEVGHATNEQLLRAAEMTTLTATPGAEGSWARNFAIGLQQMRRDVPEVRYIVPVFNVAANALGQTLARTPIAFAPGFGRLFPETTEALAGKMGPVAEAEARGRMMMGGAFLTAGLLLNRAGLLTGAGPQDPTDRKVWLMDHQPYSIRIGDNWVRYDRMEIMGGLLSIPATIADATTHRAMDKGAGDLVWSGVGALAQWFRDRAALQNASALLGVGDDPTQNVENFATKFAGNVISGLLVPRAVQTMVTDVQDPVARMRNGWLDYLKAAVPGLSKQLEPVRNVLGEPVNRSADTYAEAFLPTVIAPTVSFKKDPVVDELDRLYQATGYAGGADPHNIGYGYFNPKSVALEDGRSLFDHFMQARQVMKVNGYTLRETLGQLFNSPEYNSAVDADSGEKQTSLGDNSRGYMVKHVFDTFNDAIKGELAANSDRANSYLVAAAAKQKDDAYLSDVSADSLVANPDIYRARGINADAYSAKLQAHATGALGEALGVHE